MRESRGERRLKLTVLGLLAAATVAAPFAPASVADSLALALAGLAVGLAVVIWAAVRAVRRDGFEFPAAILRDLPAPDRRRVRWARLRGEAVPEQLVPTLLRYARRQATNQAGVGWSMAGVVLINTDNLASSDSPFPAPLNAGFGVAVAAVGVWADYRAQGWGRLADAQEARLQARVRRQWTP